MPRPHLWPLALLLITAPALPQEAPGPVVPQGRGELEAAVAELIETSVAAVEAAPEDPDAWASLCMAYEANLLWPEASRCYRRLAELAADEPLWRLHHAVTLVETGEVEEARAVLEELVAGAPDLLAARERLGLVYLELGELEAAARVFEAMAERWPESAPAHLGAGEVALERGDVEGAAAHLERALELDRTLDSAYYQLGLAYRALGRHEEARLLLARGAGTERRRLPSPLADQVATYSVHLTARIEVAGQLIEADRLDEAASVLEELAARHPENVTVLNDLAVVYMRQGELMAARRVLERALALDEENFGTHLNLSAWSTYAGRPLEAVAHARRAVEIAPDEAATHMALARTLGDPQALAAVADPAAQRREMLAELEAAIDVGGAHPDAYLQLARESWQDGEIERALATLDDARSRWPDFWPGDLMRAWILARQGRRDEARSVLERVREVAPDHPDVARLEEILASERPDDTP